VCRIIPDTRNGKYINEIQWRKEGENPKMQTRGSIERRELLPFDDLAWKVLVNELEVVWLQKDYHYLY
jgi:hypothetical protein